MEHQCASVLVLIVMEGGSVEGKGKEPCIGESSAAAYEWVVTTDGTRKQLQGSIDDPWSHGEKWKKQGFKCAYCGCAKESGGKTRLRCHLAGLSGDGKSCLNVPKRVREETTQAGLIAWKINQVVMSARTNQIVLKAEVVVVEGAPLVPVRLLLLGQCLVFHNRPIFVQDQLEKESQHTRAFMIYKRMWKRNDHRNMTHFWITLSLLLEILILESMN
ncbi:hypothetical protein ZEAMMB73_Zm00001d030105 [Zea mays]|uniref:BED-type domain-containing protein n=1 Tax=Zea mays TaxID=4577 RepID=A0A1D6K9K5_MAIZE|nr:hypothetical protein ZEAMMB73_Zm00001d030105 [Zea mays]